MCWSPRRSQQPRKGGNREVGKQCWRESLEKRGRSEGRQRGWSRKEEGVVWGEHLGSSKEKISAVLFGTVGLSRWAGSCRIWKALGKQGFQVVETSPRFFMIFFELSRHVDSTSFRHQPMAPLLLRAGGWVIIVTLVLGTSAVVTGVFPTKYNTNIVNASQCQKCTIFIWLPVLIHCWSICHLRWR